MKQLCLAEAIGTYALVFSGTGAIVINTISGGAITHVGIALTFGLIVMAMIYAFGDISGCHINPAVTIAMTVAGRFPLSKLVPYIASQAVGAVLASLTLRLLFRSHPEVIEAGLGGTFPFAEGSDLQSFVLEFILTFLLMYVVLCVSTGAKEKGIMAGAAIGAVVALEAMFAGPICGASMNPIRSFGPAVVSGRLDSLWVYLTAPTLGAIVAVFVFNFMGAAPTPENLEEVGSKPAKKRP